MSLPRSSTLDCQTIDIRENNSQENMEESITDSAAEVLEQKHPEKPCLAFQKNEISTSITHDVKVKIPEKIKHYPLLTEEKYQDQLKCLASILRDQKDAYYAKDHRIFSQNSYEMKCSIIKQNGHLFQVLPGEHGKTHIGSGKFSVKYGWHVNKNKIVAIKIIDPSKHPHAQELAENEASINQVLGRSPAFPVGLLKCNMTQTFFVFKTKEGVLKQKMAIVMDLQQGVDFLVFCEEIRDRKRPRISLGNILLIFENMINEIICLHSLGILHRDIKLDSFVFDETTFKVIDFDLSVQTKNNIYQSNFGLGTEDYLAPELQNSFFQAFFPQQWFKNKVYKYNEKTEAYALGMCFYVAFENIANVSQNHPIFLKIRQLHEAMRQKDANQRPSLKEVLKSVKKLQEENNAFEARMNKPGQSSSLAQGVASRGSPGK